MCYSYCFKINFVFHYRKVQTAHLVCGVVNEGVIELRYRH
jgi:hypothetical protein